MALKRIYVDFHKVDNQGRLVLTTLGTIKDLDRYGIELKEGMRLAFYSDDEDMEGHPDELRVDGTVLYDTDRGRWIAEIDWNEIRHASDTARG